MNAEVNLIAVSKLLSTLYISAFLLHFVWEMWQVPFYFEMANLGHWEAVLICTKATIGDGLVALSAYVFAAIISEGGLFWLVNKKVEPLLAFLVGGLFLTGVLELLSTKLLDRWQYSEFMPLIPYLDVGILPLLQWLILPPITLWLASVFMKGLLGAQLPYCQ